MKRLLLTLLLASIPAVASAKTMNVTGALDRTYIPTAEPTEVWATINVKAGQAVVKGKRAPLNLGLVVDRSTSMADGKLVQAKVAAQKLIQMLQPTDRITIVSYGSDVSVEHPSVLATPSNKELLSNAIKRIELSGSTNLSGGFEQAKKLVLKQSRDNTINRVLLMSDGHANVGTTSIEGLRALAKQGLMNGVSLTTMGVGLDYNEEIMTEMAQEGAGNYYFIDDAKMLAGMFEKEFKGLASTVARKTRLVIDAQPGVEVLEVKGFKHTSKGNKTTIRMAEFFSNQRKDILVKLAVSPQKAGKTGILKLSLSYEDVIADNKRQYASRLLSATATSDVAKLKKRNRNVMKRVQQIKTAEAFVKAMEEQDRGNAAEAEKIVRSQRMDNKAFVKEYNFEDDEAFGRVDAELQSVEKAVKKPKSSKASKRMRKKQKSRAYEMSLDAAAF